MQFTNVLMVVAVIAVVVSAVNLVGMFSVLPTGQATESDVGATAVEIVESLDIMFTTTTIDWQTGFVDPAGDSATLDSKGGSVGAEATTLWATAPVTSGLVLDNIGNIDADLWLKTNKNADDFICGSVTGCGAGVITDPAFEWWLSDVDAGSCANKNVDGIAPNPDVEWSAWTTVSKDLVTDGLKVCDGFLKKGSGTNTIEIDVRVTIPEDAVAEPKTATITVGAEKDLGAG